MIPILIILLGCIIYFIGKNTPEKAACNYSNLKPTVFDNFTNLLLSPEQINNAFSGKEPVIVKNMKDFRKGTKSSNQSAELITLWGTQRLT